MASAKLENLISRGPCDVRRKGRKVSLWLSHVLGWHHQGPLGLCPFEVLDARCGTGKWWICARMGVLETAPHSADLRRRRVAWLAVAAV